IGAGCAQEAGASHGVITQGIDKRSVCLRECGLGVKYVDLCAVPFVVTDLSELEGALTFCDVVGLRVKNCAGGSQVGPCGANLQLNNARGLRQRVARFFAERDCFSNSAFREETVKDWPRELPADEGPVNLIGEFA